MKWVAPRDGFDEVFDPCGEARVHDAALEIAAQARQEQ